MSLGGARCPTVVAGRRADALGQDAHLLVRRAACLRCARKNFLFPLNGTSCPSRIAHRLRGRCDFPVPFFLSVCLAAVSIDDEVLRFNTAARIVRGSVFWPDIFRVNLPNG